MNTNENSMLEMNKKIKKVKRLKWLATFLGSFPGLVVLGAIFFCVMLIGVISSGNQSSTGGGTNTSGVATNVNLPPEVLRWQDAVIQECNAQGVPELVPYVLGIIMVESGGRSEKLPDIMQSSGATRFSISTLVRNESVA